MKTENDAGDDMSKYEEQSEMFNALRQRKVWVLLTGEYDEDGMKCRQKPSK